MSRIVYHSSPEPDEAVPMPIPTHLKQAMSGQRNVVAFMKKLSKVQLAHSMAFNLQKNLKRNKLTRVTLHDSKPESFKTVGRAAVWNAGSR